jgi:hypothetical protein
MEGSNSTKCEENPRSAATGSKRAGFRTRDGNHCTIRKMSIHTRISSSGGLLVCISFAKCPLSQIDRRL